MSIGLFIFVYIAYNKAMEFWEFLTKKYIEWRGDAIGHTKTVSDFAEWIGVPQSNMSYWMKRDGKKPRAAKQIKLLVDKFGMEVYDALGLPRPEEEDPFLQLPSEWRERFLAAQREYTDELAKRGLTTDTPESRKIITDALSRWGINFSINEGE